MTVPPITPPPGGPAHRGAPPAAAAPSHSTTSYYGQPGTPPASKTMAGWALGLSIFNCFGVGALVAIGLGIAVSSRASATAATTAPAWPSRP